MQKYVYFIKNAYLALKLTEYENSSFWQGYK